MDNSTAVLRMGFGELLGDVPKMPPEIRFGIDHDDPNSDGLVV